MVNVLDNAIWEALSTHQQYLNAGTDQLKYFPKEISPLFALKNWDQKDHDALQQYLPADRSFFVLIAREITIPDTIQIQLSLPLYQMVATKTFSNQHPHHAIIRKLSNEDVPQMLKLTEKIKPGPFGNKTIEFGHYYGIFEEDQLVSMAGQRLQTHHFTEVSAICTDPAHLGKGYAAALTQQVCSGIYDAGKTPFLHVRQDNAGAIKLYEKLGFEIRADIYFAIFKKKEIA
ncbi:GNAT family N-acetyltransferase [Sediminibacterium sp. KACHI17]|uniref:GNAT family N-acetyltransferase n=1 Tax=Sediminibacterium sp. KACHI17 TaxID=1751071 RepID=A0AAT9GKQ1_9BACT